MAKEPKVGDVIDGWEVVFSYSTEQAVADGVLVEVGRLKLSGDKVYFTANLMDEGSRDDEEKVKALVQRGLELLRRPDP